MFFFSSRRRHTRLVSDWSSDVCSSDLYNVLKREFSYLGVGDPGPIVRNLFEIGRPDLDWVLLAKGLGVPGTRVASLDEFAKIGRASCRERVEITEGGG